MIEANNPGIDFAALERRIEVEVRQPEKLAAPSLPAGAGMAAAHHASAVLALKMRLRGIPVIGPMMAMINRWQRRRRIGPRLLATPYLGYAVRWLKSLALVHETRGRLEVTIRELGAMETRLNMRLSELRQEVGFVEQRLRTQISLSDAHLADMRAQMGLTEQHLADLRQAVAEEKRRIAENRTEILFQQRRLTTALETGNIRAAAAADSAGAAALHTDALDSYYAAFEAAFRGSREEIKNRLRVYLDRVSGANSNLPVLDIGCGRGEWIELLKEQGVAAYGIDLNSVFIADARAQDLDVRQAEALAHLRSLGDASLAGLTGFHIIEHLELNDLISIIDEANRVLAPGGFLLFETPNPENLIVGASSFWNDPTHRSPLPPSVMRFMAGQRGFIDAEVIYLHEAEDALKITGGDEVADRLNQLLYGPMDYAIWARKA